MKDSRGSPPISELAMKDILSRYGIVTDEELRVKILAYMSLLEMWNRRISLTKITDPMSVLKFHFGESFFAAPALSIVDGRLADVGTGAGFPGIPLKMICPKLQVTLIESNLKKCAFLAEAIRTLNLDGIKVVQNRMEDLISPECVFDFVAARAIGHTQELLRFAGKFLSSSGKVILWLGDGDTSLISSKFTHWRWSPSKRIPFSDRRSLLVGERLSS